ncbi:MULTISPECIES: cation diffusion facilitator family transporter [unclassified Gemella]|uniref:cation diffusion facilitator family transporter n=1 Tax=unclassified Gemella TaxID=2624949 RepID=UPI001D167702|nr:MULTISPECIES: cation diffusion facilitator family transporter [unclassified Gemella]
MLLNLKNIYISLTLTLAFALLEFIGGILSNSLALIGDSFHMLSDVLALGGAAIAIYFSSKKPTKNFTFGYLRLEIITAFVNGLLLLAISFYILIEAAIRIFNPRDIDFKSMFLISLVGLMFNIFITFILHNSLKHEHNLNVQSAIWHFIGDLLNSIGVIISSIIIYFTDWFIVDAIMSAIISIILFKGGYKITKKAFLILMDHTNLDLVTIQNDILSLDKVIRSMNFIFGTQMMRKLMQLCTFY